MVSVARTLKKEVVVVLDTNYISELCEELACEGIGGFRKDGNAVYIDPFGCGLEINFARSRDGRFTDLTVFFGEREVFSEKSFQNDNEYVDAMIEEPPHISHTLIDICRREANANRVIMKQLRRKIFDVLSVYGCDIGEKDDIVERCEAEFDDNGVACALMMRIRDCGCSVLSVRWDKKEVFSYDWVGDIDMDENGKGKFYRGKWEQCLLKVWSAID